MPTLYVIDINIYSVFATPVKGKVSVGPWKHVPSGPVLRDPGKKNKVYKIFQDPCTHTRDFALFCKHLTVSG